MMHSSGHGYRMRNWRIGSVRRNNALAVFLFFLWSPFVFGQPVYVHMTSEYFDSDNVILLRHPIRFTLCTSYGNKELADSSEVALNELADFLKQHDNLYVEIGVHTDSRGSAESNLSLSANQSQAICAYLIDRGVDSFHLAARGYGEAVPLRVYHTGSEWLKEQPSSPPYAVVELTEAYIHTFKKTNKRTFEQLHALNRRVEVRIIGIRE